MSEWRPADDGPLGRQPSWQVHYVHSAVIVPAHVVRWVAARVDFGRLRDEARRTAPDVYTVLVAMRAAEVLLAREVPPQVPTAVPAGSDHACSKREGLGTAEVAARAGITTRAVTKAAQDGRLPGRQHPTGWRFDPADVDEWIARRRPA